MATLDIGGQKVTVDDSFLKLSPEQQNSTVEEIYNSINRKPVPAATPESDDSMEGAQRAYAQRLRGSVYRASAMPDQEVRRILNTADNVARMAANGATFGLADKAAGGMDYVTGNAPSYTEGVNAQRARTQAFRTANPTAATAAELAGGLGTGVGLMKNGVTLAGRFGPSLFRRSFGYGLEGGGYGAVHGAGNTFSDRWKDYVDNAGHGFTLGAAIGAGLPVAGSLAGAGYRAGASFLGPRVDGAGRGASALLRGAALADEAGLRNLSRLGPDAMAPDAGPAMLGLAQGAGTGVGKGRSDLVGALATRDQETAQRLLGSLDRNFGPAPTPSRVEAHLSGDRAYNAQAYEPALQGAPPRPAGSGQVLANDLEAATTRLRGPAQRAVRNVREMLDVPGQPGTLDRNPNTLLQTREAIDGMITAETDPKVIQQLTLARQEVDAELARRVPGIKDIDAQIAESARQSEGLVRGGQILDTGKEAIRPQELVTEIARAAEPQGTMVGPSAAPLRIKQGARADIDRRVGTSINDLGALEKTFATPNDWNYQKLGTVFGEAPRDRVAADIAANRLFRDTYQKVALNSQTAQRTAAANAMEGGAGGNVPHDITLTGAGLRTINWLAKQLSGASSATTKDEIGRLLAKRGPEAQRFAQLLLDSATKTNANANSIAALVSSPQWLAASSPVYGRR